MPCLYPFFIKRLTSNKPAYFAFSDSGRSELQSENLLSQKTSPHFHVGLQALGIVEVSVFLAIEYPQRLVFLAKSAIIPHIISFATEEFLFARYGFCHRVPECYTVTVHKDRGNTRTNSNLTYGHLYKYMFPKTPPRKIRCLRKLF